MIQQTQTLARQDVARGRPEPGTGPESGFVVRVEVTRPNLSRFDQLLCDTIAASPAGILFRCPDLPFHEPVTERTDRWPM